MAWDHLDINKPHLVYIILGGFTSIFMLCSSIIKEKLYIGEATVATICGIIFGPHAANLIDPGTWGNTDQITLEFSRIVLVVQCFAVGVELPKAYMERHWRSVTFLLVPVMTVGWLLTSLFIWAVFSPTLNWLDSLCIAACVTATDPVLASSVVGKGKFAKRVPKHLRDLLSAESGCNDGMAFPFIYLALYLIKYRPDANAVSFHWFLTTILYECIFGAIYGVMIGYIARRAIRYAHEHNYVDRESFLVFYFVLALFCAGSGSILGIDDLLVGFACGVGFSNDGWFTEKTEESHVSNVIDLLINLAFFVYFGTIIPWEHYNSHYLQLDVWRLVVVAILVIFFRRIPIMLALKPMIPDIKTWREALFAGHFGPIGVGAIFVAILARGELENDFEGSTPLATLPEPGFEHYNIIEMVWPITTFLVITSIVVHGSSIAVFTLGKHINTLTITMSYTQATDQGPSWMDRLPRIQSRSKSSMSMQRSDDEYEVEKPLPPGMLPPIGQPGAFLRRQRHEDNPSQQNSRNSSRHRSRRSKNWDSGVGPGGPISQSAIAPMRQEVGTRSDSETLARKSESPESSDDQKQADSDPERDGSAPSPREIFEEGDHTVYEDKEGNVLAVEYSKDVNASDRETFERREGRRLMREEHADENDGVAPTKNDPDHDTADRLTEKAENAGQDDQNTPERPGAGWRSGLSRVGTGTFGLLKRDGKARSKPEPERKKSHGPARAYQYGNTIIVEDEDGEVIKKYDIPAANADKKHLHAGEDKTQRRIGQMSRMLGLGGKDEKAEDNSQSPSTPEKGAKRNSADEDDEDDERLRFTISTGGRRMSKAEFIDQIRQMDPKARAEAVEDSNVPENVKNVARKDARENMRRRDTQTNIPAVREEPESERATSSATLHPVRSNDSGDLHLVDSNSHEVPIHDVSAELRKFSQRSGDGETAAERRRREALQRQNAESDSEDDGTERVPPFRRPQAESSKHSRTRSDANETAAERRRRLGALGHSKDDSESEEESRPQPSQQTAPKPGIRFADQQGSQNTQQGDSTRQSVLRWGKNVGR
ncbi:Hypothetical protein R9X50_00260800 [Acrodontium crateriforme]|uniref:Na+/H+ antiporter n=1 Tax=Acrodontium crateriforme TaxID=150365 RepID=A0AAQ3R964_9PEZI|nr:Hypothetical protein R9X50_00260800 [Acrodontium crateriforme]